MSSRQEEYADERRPIQIQSIDQIADEISRWAQSKGFRDDWDKACDAANDERARNVIGTKLMLIVSEASEALEALRDHSPLSDTWTLPPCVEDGNFMEELADIVIRVMDLSEMLGGGLGNEIVKKMEVNRERAHKHGRSF